VSAFYLTFIAVLLSGIGSREQATIAALTRRQGRRFGVLATALLVAVATCVLAALAGREMLAILPVPARPVLAAIVVGLGGLELLFLSPRPATREPTHSLGALAAVLTFQQATEAARFTLFGMVVGMAAPVTAGLGGGLGCLLLPLAAWTWPDLIGLPIMRVARRLVGAVLLVAALAVFLSFRGIL